MQGLFGDGGGGGGPKRPPPRGGVGGAFQQRQARMGGGPQRISDTPGGAEAFGRMGASGLGQTLGGGRTPPRPMPPVRGGAPGGMAGPQRSGAVPPQGGPVPPPGPPPGAVRGNDIGGGMFPGGVRPGMLAGLTGGGAPGPMGAPVGPDPRQARMRQQMLAQIPRRPSGVAVGQQAQVMPNKNFANIRPPNPNGLFTR